MKVYSIDSIKEFEDIVEEIQLSSKGDLWFRGQSCATWKLTPSAFRQNYLVPTHDWMGTPITDIHRPIMGSYTVKGYDTPAALKTFKVNAKAHFPGRYKEDLTDLEWIIIMQHHGIPTKLLDWTTDASIALYFASKDVTTENGSEEMGISDSSDEYPSGCASVWVLEPVKYCKTVGEIRRPLHVDSLPCEMKELRFPIPLIPTKVHERIDLQKSMFTLHGIMAWDLDKPKPVSSMLHKINFHVSFANTFLSELNERGISERTLNSALDAIAEKIIGR